MFKSFGGDPYLPAGCKESDIPGNRDRDLLGEYLFEQMHNLIDKLEAEYNFSNDQTQLALEFVLRQIPLTEDFIGFAKDLIDGIDFLAAEQEIDDDFKMEIVDNLI